MILHARLLETLAPWRAAPAWQVALSGGLDSTVLLHLLATLAQREALPPLSAIHIHHGLQTAADAWPEHCRALCTQLGVPLLVNHVRVDSGPSLERAARDARYQTIAAQMVAGQVLMVGQHADDQAETVLFRLLRGAGLQGLTGMPSSRALGVGHLLRPLLGVPREQILAYAQHHDLCWVEDPSNSDVQLSRNYLRAQVMPLLRERWPQVSLSLQRTVDHLREAGELLDELAAADVAAAVARPCAWLPLPCLALAPLRALSPARQRNALRYWLRPLSKMPDTDHWSGWLSLLHAGADASPVWRLAGGELHRSDDHVYWLSGDWLRRPQALDLPLSASLAVGLEANGRLSVSGQLPQGDWRIRYRQGGERLWVMGRGHRDLKRLLNEWRIPRFVRDRLPLIFLDNQLVGLPKLPQVPVISDVGWNLHWQPPTDDRGLS